MKKLSIFAFSLFAIFTLAACGSSVYEDGTYTAEGEHRQYGYEEAVVTIEDDEITSIVLKRLNADGEEVDYTEWTGEGDGDNVKPNLDQFRNDLADAMIAEQSADVDTITGATQSSNGWITAVETALAEAKK